MVPPISRKVPRVSRYSGSCLLPSPFAYAAFTLYGGLSQNPSARLLQCVMTVHYPMEQAPWFRLFPFRSPLLRESNVSFSSSGYLDVSVRRVPSIQLWIHCTVAGVCPAGLPHSEIRGSMDICSSPRLIAACHVFRRLPVPRHPPCALLCLASLHAFKACLHGRD